LSIKLFNHRRDEEAEHDHERDSVKDEVDLCVSKFHVIEDKGFSVKVNQDIQR